MRPTPPTTLCCPYCGEDVDDFTDIDGNIEFIYEDDEDEFYFTCPTCGELVASYSLLEVSKCSMIN